MPDDVTRPPVDTENVQTIEGDNVTWIEVASSGTEDEATLLRGFLESEGIAAQVENVKFRMEPVNFGTLGDIRIYVSAEDEQRAMSLLRQRNTAYERLDDDAETVVTDEGPATIDETSRAERDPES